MGDEGGKVSLPVMPFSGSPLRPGSVYPGLDPLGVAVPRSLPRGASRLPIAPSHPRLSNPHPRAAGIARQLLQ